MQTIQISGYTGYPMYFTRSVQKIGSKEVKASLKEGQMPVPCNELTGVAITTIGVTEPFVIGQPFLFQKEEHTVTEIMEERPCKGRHFDSKGGGRFLLPSNA